MRNIRTSAIVLAAGQGSRMNSSIPKQYLNLCGKPLLYYSLLAFEKSRIDEIILVVSKEDIPYCRKEIVERFQFDKVTKIISGGEERYLSVCCGLEQTEGEYVLIHDAARPMISIELIDYTIRKVMELSACTLGVPSKDTIKIVNEDGVITHTPDRRWVYNIQTPQAFKTSLIKEAYKKLQEEPRITVTDDAMVVENYTSSKVYVIEGDYRNIKITTPEDLTVAVEYLGIK